MIITHYKHSQKHVRVVSYATIRAGPGRSVRCASGRYADGRRFEPRVRQHSFVETCHEIISIAISIHTVNSSREVVRYWRKDVHLVLAKCLGSISRKSIVRLTDRLDMTIVVDWDVKPQIKHINKQIFHSKL